MEKALAEKLKVHCDMLTANFCLKRFLKVPVAVPIPIREEPAFAIIALTSAKSTLTRPGTCN